MIILPRQAARDKHRAGKALKKGMRMLFVLSQVVEILDCEVLYGGDLTCGDRVVSGVKVCTLI
jgi:hypothetical protein